VLYYFDTFDTTPQLPTRNSVYDRTSQRDSILSSRVR